MPLFPDRRRGERVGSQTAKFVTRDNLRHRRDIERAYLAAIRTAKERDHHRQFVFFPGIRFRRALKDAAKRGVVVTLLLQARVEYLLLHFATRALYGQLLQAGIIIQEYHRSMLHAKVAVVDDHWATVGSSNIDPYSLLMAREANVFVRDRGFNRELEGRSWSRWCARARGASPPTIGTAGRGSTRRRSGYRTASCALAMGFLGYGGNEWFRKED